MSVATLMLFVSSQTSGRPFVLPASAINLGICLVVIGLVFHFSRERRDNEYFFFRVEIRDPSNLTAELPIWITNQAPSPFMTVNSWFSPWGVTNASDPAYWSTGGPLSIAVSVLQHGTFSSGKSIHPGDYQIEYDATYRGLSFHFFEHLTIEERDGSLIQRINVYRWIGGENEKVVYSFPISGFFKTRVHL